MINGRAPIVRAVVGRPSGATLTALGALAMLVALGCWALSSPVGSSPDEDYHLASIWCSHGIEAGVCEPGTTAEARALPEQLARVSCYRFELATSATCQTNRPPGGGMVETKRGNWAAGRYPPVFYWFHGLFVGDDVSTSVLAMRLVNALLFVGLIAAVYALLPAGLRRSLVGGALITAVPLGAYLAASMNPSGWAMLSAITLLVSVTGHLAATDRRRRYALGAMAALSLLVGAGARADAALYAIGAIGVAVILAVRGRPGPRMLRQLIYPAVLAGIAFVSYRRTGLGQAVSDGALQGKLPFTLSRLMETTLDVPALWPGGLGGWGLGWLDVIMPGAVWVGSWSAFAGVVFVAVAGIGARGRIGVGLIALAALVEPTYVLVATGARVGAGVQPRYILPLVAMLAVTVMIRLTGPALRLTGGQRWIVVVALTVANAAALHSNIKRYTVGVDGISWNLDHEVEWWWRIPLSPLGLWILGGLAFGVAITLLTHELTVPASAVGSPDNPRAPAPGPDAESRHRAAPAVHVVAPRARHHDSSLAPDTPSLGHRGTSLRRDEQ